MMRGPYCGPVARPKLGLPTAPLTAKFVRLNGLNALALNCSRILLPSPVRPDVQLLHDRDVVHSTGGWRKWPLYWEDVPKANWPGTENAAALK